MCVNVHACVYMRVFLRACFVFCVCTCVFVEECAYACACGWVPLLNLDEIDFHKFIL